MILLQSSVTDDEQSKRYQDENKVIESRETKCCISVDEIIERKSEQNGTNKSN